MIVKFEPKDSATIRVINPRKMLRMDKVINQIYTKTEEFIEGGDNKMISCYINSVEKFISTYDLDINESTSREVFQY